MGEKAQGHAQSNSTCFPSLRDGKAGSLAVSYTSEPAAKEPKMQTKGQVRNGAPES
jgi:hypothetical protein